MDGSGVSASPKQEGSQDRCCGMTSAGRSHALRMSVLGHGQDGGWLGRGGFCDRSQEMLQGLFSCAHVLIRYPPLFLRFSGRGRYSVSKV